MAKHKPARAKRAAQPEAGPESSAIAEVNVAASSAEAARQRMIAEAAYYRAQKRGFTPGCELDDWLAAEVEVTSEGLPGEPDASELH